MNWTKFQTYGMAPDKAFEVLCNQLFENWCKEKYTSDIISIRAVNGAGGDGGVESYAVLKDRSIIGLQAKWFPSSVNSSQFTQIKKSIETAKKVRPEINRYIVCVPRDLSSKTAKSEKSEESRWEDMCGSLSKKYPDLALELWTESKLLVELQKPCSSGIFKFWFEKAEISEEIIYSALEKAKNSWLATKYIPELNTYGKMASTIDLGLGNISVHREKLRIFEKIHKLCEQFYLSCQALMSISEDDTDLKDILEKSSENIKKIDYESLKIISWYRDETMPDEDIDIYAFNVDFNSISDRIRHSNGSSHRYFHISEVTKILYKLSAIDYYNLLEDFEDGYNKKSLLFLGAPGTGKTHGVGAVSEKILKEEVHIPILIQARNIPINYNWKDIICDCLGLSLNWSEEEIWQALVSLSHRKYFQKLSCFNEVKFSPKVIIFVDGLDESSTHERWIERIRETNTITANYSRIRFCFTSRPVGFSGKIDYAKVERLSSIGDAPTYLLFDKYTNAYNITASNCGWVKYTLTTPLALKLFCELNQNSEVVISDRSELSMTALWRKKIENIEHEYCKRVGENEKNQYILTSIVFLSKQFVVHSRIERTLLIDSLTSELKISADNSMKLIEYLESYGILNCFCERGKGLSPDIYYYYPGIQGYFDFASAIHILSQYSHPKDIDFDNYKSVQVNTLNSLAIISIQKYKYLLTRNPTIDVVIDEWDKQELQFYALLHADYDTAMEFRERTLEFMNESADGLITIVNQLILPLSKDHEHPLGVKLLDDFLNSFEKPAHRDIVWSVPGYLRDSVDKRWYQSVSFELEESFLLEPDDKYNGCPTIYAWALSSVNNAFRKKYRNRLMEWAKSSPDEYYKLFVKFSSVNDQQIKSDLFSILMCLVYDEINMSLIKKISEWILTNILHPEKIDINRDISVRYYSIAIIKKAIMLGLLNENDIAEYMPPYFGNGNEIDINKDAFSGTRMNGYSAIDYDLSRYVLIDHIESHFHGYSHKKTKQFENLIDAIILEKPEYEGMTVEQFILSAAYAYVLDMGWNEKEFYNFDKDEIGDDIIGGVDCSILRTYSPATHGIQSSVMSICEKYVWQARNVISGFLSDRLLYGDNNTAITDYSMLCDFIIPIQELHIIDPDNIPDDRPWHIPEKDSVVLEGIPSNSQEVVDSVMGAATLDWGKWIYFKNNGRYSVETDELLSLSMYSSFGGTAGVETHLFVNTVMIDQSKVEPFVDAFIEKGKKSNSITNPTEWSGGIDTSCYITPKEVCWFPWKSRYNSHHLEEFEHFNLISAVDECCYNSSDYGDVHFDMPSAPVRNVLGITDSDGYLYFDKNQNIIAEQNIAGEKWGVYQKHLVVNSSLLFEKMEQSSKALVWIMKERRMNSGLTTEKFGKFGIDREKSYIGYFDGHDFIVKETYSNLECYIEEAKKL